MKKYLLTFIFSVIFTTCTNNLQDDKLLNNSYLNSTEQTKLSDEKIDNKPTYEVIFNLGNPVECINAEMEGVFINRTFPNEKTPKQVYFIVEKKLQLAQSQGSKNKYMTIGKNFNNDWEIHSPVTICVNRNDIISSLEATEYRIRFTIFEKIPFYYTLNLRCGAKIIFD